MADNGSFHEDLNRTNSVESGSDRSFGVVFSVVFALISFFPLIGGGDVRYWALVIAIAFLCVAFVAPKILAPLNSLWARFGALLHHIVTPIILGFIFFGVITPMAILFKILGKDPLRLRFEPASASYWIKREPPGPDPQSMKNQF